MRNFFMVPPPVTLPSEQDETQETEATTNTDAPKPLSPQIEPNFTNLTEME